MENEKKKLLPTKVSAAICLVVALLAAGITGKGFLDVKQPDEFRPSEALTEQKMLSEYFDKIAGTNGDTPVYIFDSGTEGGTMLVLGGTHSNEPAGYMAAITILENLEVTKGRVIVIPRACNSGFMHNDPQEATPLYMHYTNANGEERRFRVGSRAGSPADQWPDPDVYVHTSGQRLSGSETRNLNRCYPGRPDGTLMEQTTYAIVQLIEAEGVDLAYDLHEASPEYPVNNATVAHEKCMDFASMGMLNLAMMGIQMNLEPSPTNLHGLTHRELGDFTESYPILMEVPNASQGRLHGAINEHLVLTGQDKYYVSAANLGLLYVPYDESGHPIEERVGRHLQGVQEYAKAFSEAHPDMALEFGGFPGYEEMFLSADPATLGGPHLGTFLN